MEISHLDFLAMSEDYTYWVAVERRVGEKKEASEA